MTLLVGALLAFFALGIGQILLANRLVDAIHGGPGRRTGRGRSMDLMVMRGAGAFISVVAGVVLAGLAVLGRL